MEKDFKKNINIKKTPFFFSFVVCLVLLFAIYSSPFTVSTVFSAGLQNYNVGSSGATNYEVGEAVWNGNIFQVQTRAGGTGTLRPLQIRTGTSVGFYMDTVGNVGIGTTQANNKLNVGGGIDLGTIDTSNLFRLSYDATNGGTIQSYIGGAYAKMSLNPGGGNVGIGTNNPSSPIHLIKSGGTVNSPNTALILDYESDTTTLAGGGTAIELRGKSSGGNIANYSQARIRTIGFDTNNTHGLVIDVKPDGGTALTEVARFLSGSVQVTGTGSFTQPIVVGTPTATTHATTKSYVDSMFSGSGQWTTSGTNIYSTLAGNVGVGTASPTDKLSVVGSTRVIGNVSTNGISAPSVSSFGLNSAAYVYGLTNSPTWNTSFGSYVNNNATAPDNTTTAGTYTLSATPWDLYQGISVTSGVSYKVGAWVKLGTATNFCMVVNNSVSWNTIGGKCFTSSDGLSTSGWTYVSYSFTSPGSIFNLHIGAHLENNLTQQTAGTVYVWNWEVIKQNGGAVVSSFNGNLGIGTTAPAQKLDVAGNVQIGSGNYLFIGSGETRFGGDTGTAIIYSNNAERMRINSSGNVGIATTTPSYKLDVVGGGQFSQPIIVGTPTIAGHAATKSYVDSMFTGSGQWTTNGGLVYLTSTTQNLGIGTTGPSAKLDISVNTAADGVISFKSLNSAVSYGGGVSIGSNSGVGAINLLAAAGTTSAQILSTTGGWRFSTALNIGGGSSIGSTYVATTPPTDGLIVQGNLGIGTTGPGAKLQIGPQNTNHLLLTSGNNDYGWRIDTNDFGAGNVPLRIFKRTAAVDTEVLTIRNEGGNVGIGVTNPQALLHVAGEMVVNSGNWYAGRNAGGTNQPLIRSRGSGYQQSSYPGIQVGQTGDHVALFIDPVSVTGGSFNGSTNEIFLPNVVSFLQADSAGTNWLYTGTGTLVLNNGSVGIGVSPSYKLDVAGTGQFSQPVIVGTPTTGTHATTKSYVDSMFTGSGQWTTSGTNIYSSLAGNVGIGTVSPGSKLVVSAGSSGLSFHTGTVDSIGFNRNAADGAIYDGTKSAWQFSARDTYFALEGYNGAASSPWSITKTGNVGIGTTSPTSMLQIQNSSNRSLDNYSPLSTDGNGANIIWSTNTTGSTKADVAYFGAVQDGATQQSGRFYWQVSNAGAPGIVMTLNKAGNLGIGSGVIVPASKLGVVGNVSIGATYGTIAAPTSGMIIEGNVGIGTTAPTAKLELGTSGLIKFNAVGANTATIGYDGSSRFTIDGSNTNGYSSLLGTWYVSGNVGIATTTPSYTLTVSGYGWFNQPVIVGTPTASNHATTKSYVDSIVGGSTSSTSNYVLKTGDAMSGSLNMNGNNITAVNKLTVTTIDPLYQIQGAKYSTYASAIAGGVKEEYVGRGKLTASISNDAVSTGRQEVGISNKTSNELINNSNNKNSIKIQNSKLKIQATEYQYIIDFNNVKRGSDLWVWYHAIDFSKDNIEVLATAYGVPVPIAYTIEDNKIIFKTITNNKLLITNDGVEFSYRLVGKRFDWREWPTYAKDQNEPAGLIVK